MTNPQPTLAGFAVWVADAMGVPTAWLPSETQMGYAYDVAIATVLPNFQCVPGPIYMLMVYNLGGHFLATWTQDPTTSPPYPFITIEGQSFGFWEYLRKKNNINGFTTGTVSSSSDEGTSVALVVPKQATNLTIAQLALTTSPWGRTYLGWAQSWNVAAGIT